MNSLPIDVLSVLQNELQEGIRPPDGKLHPSTDLFDLRHAQLRYAGFPENERNIGSQIRLETGTMWHERLHAMMRASGVPFMEEVDMTPWLPEGWAGTLDWLLFDPGKEAWVLGDIKTVAGSAIEWRKQDGMSEQHWLQLSAYFHAARRMGLRLVNQLNVIYMPYDNTGDDAEPYISTDTPASEEEMDALMNDIRERCQEFVNNAYDPDLLAPQLEREQKVFWDGKRNMFTLKLVPHWLTKFCDFGSECGCSEQGETKIGEFSWEEGELLYTPRKGFDDIEPTTFPRDRDVRRRFASH